MAYNAASWASRDIVAETKLDNMTENQRLFYLATSTGWYEFNGTFTRTGDHEFTVSGDQTAIFTKGTKVSYDDGSVDYGIVASSSESGGTTTVTLVTNTDYAMADTTIAAPRYSYAENPQGFPGWKYISCKAKLSTNQLNITNNTFVKINLDAETWDTNSNYDTGNYRFVAPITGYYTISACIGWQNVIANKRYASLIYVDGSSVAISKASIGDDTGALSCPVSVVVPVTAGEYIELYGWNDSGVNTVDVLSNADHTFLIVDFAHI